MQWVEFLYTAVFLAQTTEHASSIPSDFRVVGMLASLESAVAMANRRR